MQYCSVTKCLLNYYDTIRNDSEKSNGQNSVIFLKRTIFLKLLIKLLYVLLHLCEAKHKLKRLLYYNTAKITVFEKKQFFQNMFSTLFPISIEKRTPAKWLKQTRP